MFVELTLANGQPLDIPIGSIQFFEELDNHSKESKKAQSGLFYDVGGGLTSALVLQDFPELEEQLAPRAEEFIRLRSAEEKPLMFVRRAIIAIRGLDEEDKLPGTTQIVLRLGEQSITMNVMETRDEIREKLDG